MRGWRRIGVVLSVLWFAGFGWWLRQDDYDRARTIAGYDLCSAIYDTKRDAPDFSEHMQQVIREFYDCENQAGARFVSAATPWWAIIVADAFSVGALWSVAWIAVAVGRWVTAGFRHQT
jgi:hypothetical protein